MDFARDDVREVVNGKGAFVGNDRLGTAAQPSHEEILKGRGWELAEAIHPVSDSLETPVFGVFRESLP
jgi:hypothetical protein